MNDGPLETRSQHGPHGLHDNCQKVRRLDLIHGVKGSRGRQQMTGTLIEPESWYNNNNNEVYKNTVFSLTHIPTGADLASERIHSNDGVGCLHPLQEQGPTAP